MRALSLALFRRRAQCRLSFLRARHGPTRESTISHLPQTSSSTIIDLTRFHQPIRRDAGRRGEIALIRPSGQAGRDRVQTAIPVCR
jgi:hypothetical protein